MHFTLIRYNNKNNDNNNYNIIISHIIHTEHIRNIKSAFLSIFLHYFSSMFKMPTKIQPFLPNLFDTHTCYHTTRRQQGLSKIQSLPRRRGLLYLRTYGPPYHAVVILIEWKIRPFYARGPYQPRLSCNSRRSAPPSHRDQNSSSRS